MTAGALKEYIGNVYQLEVSLYNQKALFKSLLDESSRLAHTRGEALHKTQDDQFRFNVKDMLGFAVGGACVGTLIGAFTAVPFFAGTAGGMVVGCALCALLEWYDTMNARRDNKPLHAANAEIAVRNRARQGRMRTRIDVLDQEMEVLRDSVEQTKSILKRYYEKDIVFPKYRNLPAISSIYEYLCAGRCTALEGHEGAYNLFESELRQNIIIGKLDDVISRLDEIARNQHMLYQAIQESNAGIKRLTQAVNRVAESAERIESSAEVTAYNSGLAAKNLQLQTWLELARL